MGVAIYYIILAAVIVFGRLMPQSGKKKKNYIILMAAIHAFVSGSRYMLLTGDLQKYAHTFIILKDKPWFSEDAFSGGRNFLFFWFLKAINLLTDSDFQIVLIIIAVFIEIVVAIVIFKHSPSPWLSYLTWNCFGFYVFGFSAIKQSFAMAFIMLAFLAIMEKKPQKFVFWSVIAGCIHFPAFIFLPSYWIVRRKLTYRSIALYVVLVGLIFVFRDNIINLASDIYYEDITFTSSNGIGGRFLVMCIILLAAISVKGMNGQKFTVAFNTIAIGTAIQMFSGFDNVFTRLADYYLQMLIILIPMIFNDFEDEEYPNSSVGYKLFLTPRLRIMSIICLTVILIAFYYFAILSVEMGQYDDFLNYRFSWEYSRDTWEELVRIIESANGIQ